MGAASFARKGEERNEVVVCTVEAIQQALYRVREEAVGKELLQNSRWKRAITK